MCAGNHTIGAGYHSRIAIHPHRIVFRTGRS
jgi:hypothetical protein